jgi:hypothetical protein
MSIDNYAVERLDDTLDDIEDLAEGNIEIEDAVRRARGYLSDIENSDDDDDLLELDPDDLPSADIQDFKTRVLDAIPSGASMKFRIDVENLLANIRSVY